MGQPLIARAIDLHLGAEGARVLDVLRALVDDRALLAREGFLVGIALDQVLPDLGADLLEQEAQMPDHRVVAQDRVFRLDDVAHAHHRECPKHQHPKPEPGGMRQSEKARDAQDDAQRQRQVALIELAHGISSLPGGRAARRGFVLRPDFGPPRRRCRGAQWPARGRNRHCGNPGLPGRQARSGRFVVVAEAQRGEEGQPDQHRAKQAGDDLGDMHHRLQEHDQAEDQDRPEGTVFEIAELGEGVLLDQHDRHRAHVKRADAKADGDQEQVLGQREGADHPVEAERGIEHLEIEEGAKARPRRLGGERGAVEHLAQHLDGEEGQEPRHRSEQEIALGARRQQPHEEQHHRQHEADLEPADRGAGTQPALERGDPVDLLALVDEIGQRHHHQEGATEGRDRDMGRADDAGVFGGARGGEVERLERADAGGDHHDQQREQDAHAEDGDEDAPGQEAVLPGGAHVLQPVRVDDRVVEGERNLEHCQHRGDQQKGNRPGGTVRIAPAQPEGEREPHPRQHKGPPEVMIQVAHDGLPRSLAAQEIRARPPGCKAGGATVRRRALAATAARPAQCTPARASQPSIRARLQPKSKGPKTR
ncbi:hypothetical protein SDC9_40500 [bioreactor metagenome]|uniref:Uncharacterized protein n=1 Tax=bioreactor metagenome TaxID=1076179 RepID=A0A644VST5_9ZZZZ